ncbi:hypothetical protein AaE_013921, partial [Aphanomyces astaci]
KGVWSEYCTTKALTVASAPSNRTEHACRIPSSKVVTKLVLEFVRTRRLTRTRVVAKDILALLSENGHISVDMSNAKDVSAALRASQAFLAKQGYMRGAQKGGAYGLTKELVLKRDNYVRFIDAALKESPSRTIVYIDESYIHHHYSRHNDSLYHPDDKVANPPKAKHKGRRLCFVAGIMSDGEENSRLLGLEIFQGGKCQPKDYHGMFTHAFFVDWFGDLLEELEKLQKYGVIIAMDNAKYHQGKPFGTPTGSMKKADMLAACATYGVEVDERSTRPVVWAALKDHIDRTVKSEVESMAMERGHLVAWTPPYHSDLQPIEMVWSDVKGKVGRQYTVTTSFEDVRVRLDAAFTALPSKTIYNCIGHTERKVAAMSLYLETLDEADEELGQCSSDDEGSVDNVSEASSDDDE